MINKALEGLKYLFIGKIFQKIVETTLNILVLRQMDKNIYGLTSYFDLFNNLTLYYLKTSLKSCYQKRQTNKDQKKDEIQD